LKTLLHLAPDGAQLWQKISEGSGIPWTQPKGGSVWIVTDMAEETLAEIQVPRLYGRDRSGFIARQLSRRFPETPYKTALPTSSQTGILNRLAPLRPTLLSARCQRTNGSGSGSTPDAKVAGLWTTSGLLARLGASRTLPGSSFIVASWLAVHAHPFLKERVPIISRLIREAPTGQSVTAEIVPGPFDTLRTPESDRPRWR